MTEQQLTEFAMDTTKNIAALWESTKSAHHRLNENDRITAGIHELAKNVAMIAAEIKGLAVRLNESVERIERGQRAQGERIGAVEKAITTAARLDENFERIEQEQKEQGERIDEIEKKPAKKWETLVAQITALIVAGVVGAIISTLF